MDLSAITGSPADSRHGQECNQIKMVTVADSSLPDNALQFYPELEITLSDCGTP